MSDTTPTGNLAAMREALEPHMGFADSWDVGYYTVGHREVYYVVAKLACPKCGLKNTAFRNFTKGEIEGPHLLRWTGAAADICRLELNKGNCCAASHFDPGPIVGPKREPSRKKELLKARRRRKKRMHSPPL